MSITKDVDRLRRLALSLPRPGCDWEERPRFEPPVTPAEIVELERIAGFKFPTDLCEFLGQTSAVVAMSVHNGFWLGGVKQLLEGDSFPRIIDGESTIPIGTDGGGNAFLATALGTIWKWDHETGKSQIVATSFADFLCRVVDDWIAYTSEK